MEEDKLYNEEGYEVTRFIKARRTTVFETREEAETYSKRIRTYIYLVYNKKGMFFGYAVPK